MIFIPIPHVHSNVEVPQTDNKFVLFIYAVLVLVYLGMALCTLGYMISVLFDDGQEEINSFKKEIHHNDDESFFDRNPVTCVVVGLFIFGIVVLTLTGYWWE